MKNAPPELLTIGDELSAAEIRAWMEKHRLYNGTSRACIHHFNKSTEVYSSGHFNGNRTITDITFRAGEVFYTVSGTANHVRILGNGLVEFLNHCNPGRHQNKIVYDYDPNSKDIKVETGIFSETNTIIFEIENSKFEKLKMDLIKFPVPEFYIKNIHTSNSVKFLFEKSVTGPNYTFCSEYYGFLPDHTKIVLLIVKNTI